MRDRLAQISLTGVALLIGLLIVGQLRSQARPTEISSMSAQDLSTLIETLSDRNRELRTALSDAQEQIREYRLAEEQGQSALDVSREDLRRIDAFSGQSSVNGQGIVLDVSGAVDAIAVNDLLNELRNAGAEAIAVGGVRVVTGVVVIGPAGEATVEGVTLGDVFELEAIGAPDKLTGSLTRSGGVIAQLAATLPDVVVTVTPVDRLELPATTRSLVPAHGQPRL